MKKGALKSLDKNRWRRTEESQIPNFVLWSIFGVLSKDENSGLQCTSMAMNEKCVI